MKKIQFKSPNFDSRDGAMIDSVVLHYTDMPSAEAALDHLCNPDTQVSAHFLIDEEGIVYCMVPMEKNAWHAGKSYWRGVENLNKSSIGIELQNPGHSHGLAPFPPAQMESLVEILHEIKSYCYFNPLNLVGHQDIAPDRKLDPGPLFDWRILARHGLTIWPVRRMGICNADAILTQIGYNPKVSLEARIKAFQTKYCPENITGIADEQTKGLLMGMVDIMELLS